MRTKHILLTAALVAAGVASSMAQSNVYSLNVVGYVNVPLNGNGYSLIANQLDVDGTNNVNNVLVTGVPDQSQLFQWNGTSFNQTATFFAGTGWLDLNNGGNPATATVPLGYGFFIYNPGPATNITLVGQVVQTTNSFTITAGNGFYSVVPPVASDLDTNGFPSLDQAQLFYYVNGNYSQVATYFAGTGWLDLNNGGNQVFPTPAVGQGFLVYNPGSAAVWTQSFTVH